MRNNLVKKILMFVFTLLLLIIFVAFFYYNENNSCLGIKLISPKDTAFLENEKNVDIMDKIFFCNEHVPIDKSNSTIFLPQYINEHSETKDLQGFLSIKDPDYNLFFLKDEYFDDLGAAIKESHKFKLYAVDLNNDFIIYNVIFTTLPVMKIDTIEAPEIENGKVNGNMVLFPSNATNDDFSQIEHSRLEIHVRGNTTSRLWKKPYKISLKNKNGNNKNINLLGMGSDDDWILNAMYVDDSKMREKLFMDLWNEMCKKDTYNYHMSNSKYVELVLNDEYKGLYLLQNRIDKKYLGLNDDDILLKGGEFDENGSTDYSFLIKYSNLNSQETYHIIDEMLLDTNLSFYNKNNIIDIFLYLQLFSANDNLSFKNMYYILKRADNNNCLILLPWDTDVSLGILWDDDLCDYVLDYDLASNIKLSRPEMETLLDKYPGLQKIISKRWLELEGTILSEDNIIYHIKELNDYLEKSGSFDRDRDVWGSFRETNNIEENMIDFVKKRIKWMNDNYSSN